MGIGAKLEKLMKERNTNANELASKIGISPQTIYSMIKRDSKKADIEVLLKISRELGVEAEYFCNDDYHASELTYDDIEDLLARNAGNITKEEKLRLMKLLLEEID